MRILKTHIAALDLASNANITELTSETDKPCTAINNTLASDSMQNNSIMVTKATKSFNIKNINLCASYNDCESETEMQAQMVNLKDNNDGFSFPPAKKVARQQKSNDVPTTSTNNKYGILDDNEKMDTINNSDQRTQTQRPTNQTKKIWIPPIVVFSQIVNYKTFSSQIQNILGHNNFRVLYRNSGTKIITATMEDRKKLIADFDDSKISFHTYTPNEEKTKKIVMKGAPEMDINEIKQNLQNQGTDVKEIIKLKTKREQESFSYLVTVQKQQSLQELRKIKNIEQCGVSWERYNKKNTYTQCFNCQEFGHAETNCHKKSRCVKCPQFHHWKNCQLKKTPTSKPYCHNCHGEHAASFKNCPVLLDYLQKRNEIAAARSGKPRTITQQATRITETTHGPNYTSTSTGTNTIPQNNNVNFKRSYRDVLENKIHEDVNTSKTLNSSPNNENEELSELLDLINIIKNIKSELRSCSNQFEKMSIIIKYLDKF